MVQKILPLRGYREIIAPMPETASAVGLRCEDRVVTLRFLSGEGKWGQPARQIRLDRGLAEELSRLLANELEDYA